MITRPFPLIRRLPYTPTKPYIRPALRLPKERAKSMTVVAGFRCADGVLLAADTLVSFEDSSAQTYQTKIININPELGMYLTYTGDVDFAKEYAHELERATVGRTESEALVLADQISKKLWEVRCITPPEDEKLWAHMLLSIPEMSSVSLYQIRGTHFLKTDTYAALGSGFPQADAFFNLYYRPWMTVKQTEYMARYVLRRVKKFVKGCGGDTDTQQVRDDGLYRSRTMKRINLRTSAEMEEDFAFFDREMLSLLVAFSDFGVDKKAFHKLLNKCFKALEEQRDDRFESAPKALKKFFQRS
jgi:20S proteasome alpha/beta subunit